MILCSNNLGNARPKPKNPRRIVLRNMTLLAGIVCEDGIVMAADSQTTRGMYKQTGTVKIHEIGCADTYALVAEAGVTSLSGEAVRIFASKSAHLEIMNKDS